MKTVTENMMLFIEQLQTVMVKETVTYSYIWYIVISGVSVIALIIIVFVVIRKKRKFKNKIN